MLSVFRSRLHPLISLPQFSFFSVQRNFKYTMDVTQIVRPLDNLKGTDVSQIQIHLNDKEKQIFGTILDALAFHKMTTVVRVAGGWVRDKVLGLESDDIDLSLDNMLGIDFARRMNEYLARHGMLTSGVGNIKGNPNKSKNLETATFKMFDIPIDVNNLRTETYAKDTRIPKMEIGTVIEDVERRDFTVNSLFYNINTSQVEDFSGKGVLDLINGILRTPAKASTTFVDDPLRVLRACRFAARFQFGLDDEIVQAARSDEVKACILQKVSRERFGIEIGKMLSDRGHPSIAFRLIVEFGLYSAVFHFPPMEKILNPEAVLSTSELESKSLEGITGMSNYLSSALADTSLSESDRRLLLFSSFMYPVGGVRYRVKKRKEFDVIWFIISESLKLPHKEASQVCLLVNCARRFNECMDIQDPSERHYQTGLIMSSAAEHWKLSFTLARVLNSLSSTPKDFDIFLEEILNSGLVGCWQWKRQPIVTGKRMISELKIKPGPGIQDLLNAQFEFRIRNVDADETKCLGFVRQDAKARGLII
eukprot:259482_1